MVEHADPSRRVIDLVTGTWQAQAVCAAAALRIPDLVADGHTDLASLAARADAAPDGIRRLMRLLTATGVFAGTEDEGYRLTPVSQLLRSDVPHSMRDMCLLYGAEFHRAWGSVVAAVRTGRAGFEHAFGRSLHDYLAGETGASERFSRAMRATGLPFADVTRAFDFPSAHTVLDVAGGNGTTITVRRGDLSATMDSTGPPRTQVR